MAAFESFDCFECSVCLEPMKARRPVVLSCLHTFCTPCIKQLYKGQRLSCPTCRSETIVPGEDVEKLPVNRDLIKIMEELQEINRNPEYLRAAENLCQTCLRKGNREQSAGICLQCARKLCQRCIDQHKMIGAFKDHHLITNVSKIRMGEKSCTKHNEDLVYICMTCLEALCIDCTNEQQHVDHLDQIIKFESGISNLREENSKLILRYNQQIEEMDLIQKDISSDAALLNISKKKLKDLCATFQKKLADTENLLRHVADSEGVLQNANKLICDKKDKACHDQNSLKIAEKYSDLAFLTHIKAFKAGVHKFENEAEIRGHTQNYTVPKVVLHDPVADDDYKSVEVATLTEHPPSKSRKDILRMECQSCYDLVAADQIHVLTFCDCRMCTECFQERFEVLIRDKQVTDWHCQFCHQPKMHGEDMDVAIIENHFQFLGIKVQQFLTKETFSIFTEKLSEWNLKRDPNFVYCPYLDCVNGFIHHGRLKVQCPQCNRFFCWKCKEAWTGDHDNKDCEEFKKIQIEKGETSIREEMKGSCITCPNCKSQFDLARGGCMHFSCTQCRYEFCGGCYQRFYNDERLGLNCKHLRNCYSNLRDMDVTQLHNLLKTSGVQFDAGDGNNDTKVCQVQETAEEDGHITETACSKQIDPNHNGMCLKHYKEYLAKVINENKIDPLPEMDVNDLCQELRRRDFDVPEKSPDEGDGKYSQTLRDLIKEKIPLQDL